MGAAAYLLLGSLCHVLLSTTAGAQGTLPNSPLGCKLSQSGPNDLQVAAFRAQLSDPKAVKDFFSYDYSAGLIHDGLSNHSDPVYILPVPRFIVTPLVVEDVVAAVQFAADYGLKVQARGTGHQLSGVALPECGVTIDMRNFADSSLDETTGFATVQTGLPSGDVAKKLVSKGRLPSIGTCKDVGVGGFALQGGLGWISRYHGAAADFIQSMDVVVVGAGKKAVRKTITASSDPDLFFGFRGAGGALGVAIAYTTATFPIPTNVQMASYSITIDKAVEVLQWFAEFTATLPKSIYDSATLLPAGSDPAAPGGAANIFLLVFNLGPKTAETEAAFQQLADFAVPRAYANYQPGKLYTEEDYLTFQLAPGECSNYTAATYWNTYFTPNGSSLDPVGISLDLINTLVAQIKASPYATTSLRLYPSPTIPSGPDAVYYNPSAWSFRDSYYLFVGDTWNVPADDASHISWVKSAAAALRPYYVGNYINQLMFEVADDASRSYEAGIFARLQGIKAQYDPNNLFRDLNYVHPPNVKKPSGLDGGILDSVAFAMPEAMAPADAMAPAMSSAEAPYPMQG